MKTNRTYKPNTGSNGSITPPDEAEGTDGHPSPGNDTMMSPGPFPLHALNKAMREIADATADVHQIPIELPAMGAVGTMAGSLGKSFELIGAANGKTSFGNLIIIPAAPKSTGKGATVGIAHPLTQASAEMAKEFLEDTLPDLKVKQKMAQRESEQLYKKITKGDLPESEIRPMRDRLGELQRIIDKVEPLLIGAPTYWVSNATSEAMAIQFARNNCSLFAYSLEAGEPVRVLMGKYNANNKGDFDVWLSGYSVEPMRTDRVQRGASEITPCLSALLFCQPSVLRELMTNEEAFERGLTARCLPFIVEPELKEDDGKIRLIDAGASERWGALIRDVLSKRERMPARIICSPGAREAFRAFHNESIALRTGKYRDIEGELGRWRENSIRLAVGQCVADDLNATELSEGQAIRAVELARWLVRSALQIIGAGRMERRLKRVRDLQGVLVDYSGKQTLRELERRHGFTHDEVKQLAADFPDLLAFEKRETGGRPTEIVSTIKAAR